MEPIRSLVGCLFLSFAALIPAFAQEDGFSYQAIARDANTGVLLANQTVNFRFVFRTGSSGGTTVYEETHSATTSNVGLVNLVIGKGTVAFGSFSDIPWGDQPVFMETQVNGISSTSEELKTVPFAKVATDMKLSNLKDVAASAPVNGQVLSWNGANWTPAQAEGSQWSRSGTTISYNSGRVFVGRDAFVANNEYFGVRTPTAADIYGGMYMDTENAAGWPFYGYSSNGIARAWSYFHTSSNSFRINISGSDIFSLLSDGKMGLRTVAPTHNLHLIHNTGAGSTNNSQGLKLQNEGSANQSWTLYTVNNGGELWIYSGTTNVGRFAVTGAYTVVSDERMKTHKQPLPNTLDRLLALQPMTYRYQHQPADAKPSIGFLAQQVAPLFPELVTYSPGDEGEPSYAVDYAGFSVAAIKAIQEQQSVIERQQAELDQLRALVEELRQWVAAQKP